MRFALSSGARQFVRRLPRNSAQSLLEVTLLALLAVQCARLLWVLATPLSPLGAWQGAGAPPAASPAAAALLAEFDPFFRAGAGGPMAVTPLDLMLFGVREDRATGRGAAIIAGADGVQRSYGIGEEVAPGATLSGVAFDHVTIRRGGADEQLFLDQSEPAPPAGPAPTLSPIVVAPPPAPAPAATAPVAPPPVSGRPAITQPPAPGK